VLSPAAGAQEPPPETVIAPPPPVLLEDPEPAPIDTTTITIHVPQPKPAPRPKVKVKAKVVAPDLTEEPDRSEEVQPQPAAEPPALNRSSEVDRSYEVAEPQGVAAEPARTPRPARAPEAVVPRAYAPRQLERGLAERVSETLLRSDAGDRGPTAAVLGVTAGDAAPFAAERSGGPSPLVFFLAVVGLATLTFAGAMPLLAAYSPETFVPVLRIRRNVSFVGLCLLAAGLTGLLAGALL
jgi:hypothetical protein